MVETQTTSGTWIVHSEAIRVEVPQAGDMRRLLPEIEDFGAPLAASLAPDLGDVADMFDLAAAPVPMFRSLGDGAVTIDLKVRPGESAAILTEVDGIFRWVWPEEAARAGTTTWSARRGPVPDGEHVLRFRLEPQGAPVGAEAGQRRGLFGLLPDGIIRRVRVRILKFVAAQLADAGTRLLEQGLRPGLVMIDGEDPSVWTSERPVSKPSWPAGRPARILLMVHGTFSSTIGSFGSLAVFAEGKAFLTACRRHYDLVLGYDHATLSQTPEANALALHEALDHLAIPVGTELDIVAFSRGGLVARVLIEQRPASPASPFRVGRVAFVGCTNGGTALAEPKNWKALVDLYTNLSVWAGRALQLAGAGTASLIVREAVKTLGGLVKALVDVAITEASVPGLAAMAPGSPLVRALNGAPEDREAGQRPRYFAFGADFETRLGQGDGGLPARALRLLADLGVDRLMGEANDLVVDTEAMTEFGHRYVRVEDIEVRADQPKIYHTVYFEQPDVVAALRRWLDLPSEVGQWAGYSPLDTAPPPPTYSPVALRRLSDDSSEAAPPFMALDLPASPVAAVPMAYTLGRVFPEAGGRLAPVDLAGAEIPDRAPEVPCHIAAEMERSPPAGKSVPVTVTVSREAIERAAGRLGADLLVVVQSERPIRLTIIPRVNCTVSGVDSAEVSLPPTGTSVVFGFEVVGQAGTGEVWVEAHQGPRRLARIVLQPVFTVVETLQAVAVLDPLTEDPPLVEMRIFDLGTIGDRLNLKFVLESRDLDVALSPPPVALGAAREQFVADIYKKLESDWGSTNGRFGQFMLAVRAFGAELFRSLLPESIRRAIWANRNRIGSIEVISQEPIIPWELLYAVDPDGEADVNEGRFLAELGLVRWVSDFGWPPARIRLRQGRARHVVPNYANPAWTLPGAGLERDMLVRLFGSQPAPDESEALCALLGTRDAFDLLHFVCHGTAQQGHVWDSALELAGSLVNGTVLRDSLTAAMVGAEARLKGSGGDRPMIFLNACQTGLSGAGLVGTGGMAESFIRRGAGLFVGAQWSVGDSTARVFAETFYTALQAGQTLTQATRKAREETRKAKEPTWLAYAVYGHPFLRCQKD